MTTRRKIVLVFVEVYNLSIVQIALEIVKLVHWSRLTNWRSIVILCGIPEIHLARFDLRQAHEDDGALGNDRCYDECGQNDNKDRAECETEVTRMPSHISVRVFHKEFELFPAPLPDVILFTVEIGRYSISI